MHFFGASYGHPDVHYKFNQRNLYTGRKGCRRQTTDFSPVHLKILFIVTSHINHDIFINKMHANP